MGGDAGNDVRLSRPSKTEYASETDEGGVTDWSSDELEWAAGGSRSVSDPDSAAGSTDRERLLAEADVDEPDVEAAVGKWGEREERDD